MSPVSGQGGSLLLIPASTHVGTPWHQPAEEHAPCSIQASRGTPSLHAPVAAVLCLDPENGCPPTPGQEGSLTSLVDKGHGDGTCDPSFAFLQASDGGWGGREGLPQERG